MWCVLLIWSSLYHSCYSGDGGRISEKCEEIQNEDTNQSEEKQEFRKSDRQCSTAIWMMSGEFLLGNKAVVEKSVIPSTYTETLSSSEKELWLMPCNVCPVLKQDMIIGLKT